MKQLSIKKIYESEIIDYFNQIRDITTGKQRLFWDWKAQNAKSINIVNISEIRKEYPEIDDYLNNKHTKIVQKECYKNAGQLTLAISGVTYIEGEISYHGIPIEHAWNKIDGKYFDITKDILFPDKSIYNEYVGIIELNDKEFRNYILSTRTWGGFIAEEFMKQYNNKKVTESCNSKLFEITDSAWDKYYERKFGIMRNPSNHSSRKRQKQIGLVGDNVPIIMNPKTLKGFEQGVRAISDSNGNLYVPLYNLQFNHGDIANSLLRSGKIHTEYYSFDSSIYEYGIYHDQENFLLLNRYQDSNTFVESDVFEYTLNTNKLIKKLKEKNPQFTYNINETIINEALNESPDRVIDPKSTPKEIEHNKYNTIHYTEGKNTYAFGYINEKLYVSKTKEVHSDIEVSDDELLMYGNFEREYFEYPGRIWLDYKVISFWVYPSKERFAKFVSDLKKVTGIDIINYPGWKIEILKKREYDEDEILTGRRIHDEFSAWDYYDRIFYSSDCKITKALITPQEYIGSEQLSPEELAQEHVKSPVLKQSKVVQGFGSEHPEYQTKQAWKRAVPIGDNKQETFYPSLKLNEDPDQVRYYNDEGDEDVYADCNSTDARAFGYYNNVFYIAKDRLTYHYDIKLKNTSNDIDYANRTDYTYPGRLWLTKKIISFWVYPDLENFKKFAKDLKKAIKVDIFKTPGWKIEVIMPKNDNIPVLKGDQFNMAKNKGAWEYTNDDDNDDLYIKKLIDVNDYVNSLDVSKEKQNIEHIKSPLLKHSKVVQGFGSEHPEYQTKQAWKRAVPMGDSKIENDFYPKLFENPNAIVAPKGKVIDWTDDLCIPFGYYNDKLFIGYPNDTHFDMYGEYLQNNPLYIDTTSTLAERGKYSGRIFTSYNYITFWNFPENKNKLKQVLNELEVKINNDSWYKIKKISVDFSNPEWKIEIPIDIEEVKKTNNVMWGDWYPNEDEVNYIPIEDYDYGYERTPEELSQEHVKSPLLKQSKVVQGFGSEHPEYQTKQAWKRMAPIGDSKQEDNFYPSLNESPDNIIFYKKRYNYYEKNARPFIVSVNNKTQEINDVLVGDLGEPHESYRSSKNFHFKYNGRLFLTPKIITFWDYPNKNDLLKIIKIISNKINENLIDKWKIEIYDDKHSKKITIKKYLKDEIESENPSAKEYEEHMMSPILKKQKVIKNFGSEHPEYQTKQAWKRMASIGDSKIENNFYPSLIESVETPSLRYESDEIVNYESKDARAFGYYNDEFLMGDNADVWHWHLVKKADSDIEIPDRDMLTYPGRLWIKRKTLSFWKFPPPEDIPKLGEDIYKESGLNIFDGDWQIEIFTDDYGRPTGDWGSKEAYVPVEKYMGSAEIPEELANKGEHVKSPLLKKQKVVQGFGSEHPEYQTKQAWKRAVPMGDSKQEKFYPLLKINESPDIYHIPNDNKGYEWYKEGIDRVFGYLNNKFLISEKKGETHYDIGFRYAIAHNIGDYYRSNFKYPGRLWIDHKLISFWIYPDREMFLKIAKDIKDNINIDILEDGWIVEIPINTKDFIGNINKHQEGDWLKDIYTENDKKYDFVSTQEYNGAIQRSKEELSQEHVKSPLLKHSKVVQGFGSEHPEYQTKQAWKRAAPIGDSKQEDNFYPSLNESPDNFLLPDKNEPIFWDDSENRVFGYSNDKFYISKKTGLTHKDLFDTRLNMKFPGRLWIDYKLISFWIYPNKEEFLKIAKDIKNEIEIDILEDGWLVEVVNSDKIKKMYDVILGNKEFPTPGNMIISKWPHEWGNFGGNKTYTFFVPTNEYIGSEQLSPEELSQEHVKSPVLKQSKVVQGFGSEHPEYQTKQAWKRAAPIGDSKQEDNFYPSLNEDDNNIKKLN